MNQYPTSIQAKAAISSKQTSVSDKLSSKGQGQARTILSYKYSMNDSERTYPHSYRVIEK